MTPEMTQRFDAIDRRLANIEVVRRIGNLNGREVEDSRSSTAQKRVFLNIVVISMLFTFSIVSAFVNSQLFCLCVTLGLTGCLYTGVLINFIPKFPE